MDREIIQLKHSTGFGNILLHGCLLTQFQKFLGAFRSSFVALMFKSSTKLGLK